MRKESISRLLLTLLTAFVMVMGVFGAAVTDVSIDTSSRPAVAGEHEVETREMGDDPISALADMDIAAQADDEGGDFNGPIVIFGNEAQEEKEIPEGNSMALAREPTGTRAAGIDAYGPYGTEALPYLEGDSVVFESDITGGNNDDYYFRWDVDSDGVFEKDDFGDVMGETDYTHEFKDNLIGQATVQAWDGFSTTTEIGSGTYFDNVAHSGEYWYWVYYWTVGTKFTLHKDVDITELGFYRAYTPYWVYNIRIWSDTGTLIANLNSPSPQGTYRWNWYSISPLSLTAGDYRISAYFRGYNFPAKSNSRGTTSDGVLEITSFCYNLANAFPSSTLTNDHFPMLDMKYEYTETVPLVLEDTADVFVDNNAPLPIDLQTTPSVGVEGSEVDFSASFFDTGVDDTWEYRWDFGDGTVSPWMSVNKWSGGGRVLLASTWSVQDDYIVTTLSDQLGDWLVNIEQFDWGPGAGGNNAPPDLDYMLQFDVVIVGTNYIPSAGLAADMGDRLAEYVDAGGNVVQMWSSFHTSDRITGRWVDEEYGTIERGSLNFGMQTLGTVYDITHPIMNGITTVGNYYKHNSYDVTSYATRLADHNTGRVLTAYNDMAHPNAPTSRVVGIAMFPADGYVSGDAYPMFANAVKWASQQADPVELPMPLALNPVSHIYVDDHPLTLTPSDVFDVSVEVRDDDHGIATPTGTPVGLYSEDFVAPFPPAGWTEDVWTLRYSSNAGGSSPEARLYWWDAYRNGHSGYLQSAPFDTTGYNGLYLEFKSYIDHWLGSGMYENNVYSRSDPSDDWTDVTPWGTISTNVGPDTYTVDISSDISTTTQIRFEHDGINSVYMDYWYVDDVQLIGFPAYVFDGLGDASSIVTIFNVFPTLVIPDNFVSIVDETVTLDFEALEITDPAFTQLTEDFYWRVNFDDDTPIGAWNHVEALIEGLDVLVYHALGPSEGGALINALRPIILGVEPDATFTEHNFLDDGAMTVDELLQFDCVVVGINWANFPVPAVGDSLAGYADAGGSVIETVASFHATPGWWGIGGRWQDEGYSTLQSRASMAYYVTSSAIYDPTHPIINGPAGTVVRFGTTIAIASPGETPGSTLLADYPAYPAVAYNDEANPNPGHGRTVGLNVFYYPGYYQQDSLKLLANSIFWAQEVRPKSPVLPTFTHNYGDNGIYYVDVQFIDDDMYWDLSSGTPVYRGPAGEEESWISHNVVPIEVYNEDPTIRPIRAYADVDLSIRMSGQKRNTATMNLYEGENLIKSITVERDPGAPDIEVMEATIQMTKDYEYTLEIVYNPDDLDGANPTWIFEGHFPDGKIKQLKHTFNSNDPDDRVWDLGSVKAMMLGHDVIFQAEASDPGSDDLAFVWNFGDSTPFGVHLFENVNPSTTVEGTSDEATVLFNQIAGDPWFEVDGNTIRSPDMNPISVTDTISHVFDANQPYYYYVHLTVMDDDVDDNYPSSSTCPGSDSEFVEIDFR